MKRGKIMFNNSYPYYNYNNGIKKINFKAFLDGAQRTLGLINQAIPVFYQIKPLYENAKTAFKVVNAIKEEPTVNVVKKDKKKEEPNYNNSYTNSPTYFL